jgi:hypothetical protein
VIVAVERRGTGSGPVRMEVIPDFTQETMTEFALRNIEVGSTIVSDKMPGFDPFRKSATPTSPRNRETSGRAQPTSSRSPIERWGT